MSQRRPSPSATPPPPAPARAHIHRALVQWHAPTPTGPPPPQAHTHTRAHAHTHTHARTHTHTNARTRAHAPAHTHTHTQQRPPPPSPQHRHIPIQHAFSTQLGPIKQLSPAMEGHAGPPAGTRPERPGGGGQGCIRREGATEVVKRAVGGGCQSGWGRLLSVTNAVEARGGLQFSSRPQPPQRGRGVQRGEGGQKLFSILGAFLNSPFHSEHFEYTHVG